MPIAAFVVTHKIEVELGKTEIIHEINKLHISEGNFYM